MAKRLLFIVVLGFSEAGLRADAGRDTLTQWSTIDALLKGYYTGVVTLGDVRKAGDFGLGTLDGLDGEMLLLDNQAYQIDGRGGVHPLDDAVTTPFAAVTFFDADLEFTVPAGLTLEQLQARIDAALPSGNFIYAVRVTGKFAELKTRSVPRQVRPFPPLGEVVKTQSLFSFADTAGVLVGFRCPSFVKSVNVPGYHFHFLRDDRTGGGHVLGLVTGGDVKVAVDITRDFAVRLPDSAEFRALDLSGDRSAELKAVESERK